MAENDDRLLYVLTVKQRMSWSAFKEAYDLLRVTKSREDTVALARPRSWRGATARALDALGHCERHFSENGNHVYVAPAILARLPRAGLPQAILLGGRSPETLPQLQAACGSSNLRTARITTETQICNLDLVPRRITIYADSVADLAGIAQTLGIRFAGEPPAWSLLQMAGSLNEYFEGRHFQTDSELNWPQRDDWELQSLKFRRSDGLAENGYGLRLSYYQDKKRNRHRHLLWKGEQCMVCEREWAIYALLQEAHCNILVYDRRRYLLGVPVSAPVPRLFARALVLCSGFAAAYVPKAVACWSSPENEGFDLYKDIPPQIADLVSMKLGQSLIEQHISVPFPGDI